MEYDKNKILDTSLFARLHRMFSTDVIIRNIGGKQLRVIDANKIQASGTLKTNSLYDRYTRLHKSFGDSLQYNPFLNYQYMRYQLYSDYEIMDQDAIISSVLDIISEEATLKNEYGDMLTITSDNVRVEKVLKNLFNDILNIEFNLPIWIRNVCKYGDFYLKLEISEKYGVYQVIPISVYNCTRVEGSDEDNLNYVKFIMDPSGPNFGYKQPSNDASEFEFYEIAHFRLLTDTNFLPYGRSYIEPSRKLFKQLTLMEDAMLIHRIMRSPEKRIFYINVAGLNPNEIDGYMEKTINKMKKTPYMDKETGEYNLKYNMQNMTEDYYVPFRGAGDTGTKIDTTKGLDYDGTNDIEYLRDKLFAALKVPKDFIGFSEDTEGKSTLAAQDIRFARTVEKIQRIIVSELEKIAVIHLTAQGFEDEDLVNFELSLTNPSIIFQQEQIALYKEKIELATQIKDARLMSNEWIYDKIFKLGVDDYDRERTRIIDEAYQEYIINEIEAEGNDPRETNESQGTPNALAQVYSANRDQNDSDFEQSPRKNVPMGYDNKNDDPKDAETAANPGRPKERSSDYGTWQSNFSRDPVGKKGLESPRPKEKENKVKTYTLEHKANLVSFAKSLRKSEKFSNISTNEHNLLTEDSIKEDFE